MFDANMSRLKNDMKFHAQTYGFSPKSILSQYGIVKDQTILCEKTDSGDYFAIIPLKDSEPKRVPLNAKVTSDIEWFLFDGLTPESEAKWKQIELQENTLS